MQKDMHYYGTYAMAAAAGIPTSDAGIIAYAAQFTDDSTRYDSKPHPDKGLLFGITTAHSPHQSLIDSHNPVQHGKGNDEQRKIWIPFHFFPGGEGDSFEEKIICTKDSALVNAMMNNHLRVCLDKPYILELIGICSHVYMDTFSHYGFSGLSSKYNDVDQLSLRTGEDLLSAAFEVARSGIAEAGGDWLGHAGVLEHPDCPYLDEWRFDFEKPRPGNGKTSVRNNTGTFLAGCEKLHEFLSRFAAKKYDTARANTIPFASIKDEIKNILRFRGDEAARCNKWKEHRLAANSPEYDPMQWERDKQRFDSLQSSTAGIATHVYRFHQAAAYHRYYVLKDLLPEHGIAVY